MDNNNSQADQSEKMLMTSSFPHFCCLPETKNMGQDCVIFI